MSVLFDATGEYVSCGSAAAVDNLGNTTFSGAAWIYPTQTPIDLSSIITKNGTSGWRMNLNAPITSGGGTLGLAVDTDGADLFHKDSDDAITANKWWFVCFSAEVTATCALYRGDLTTAVALVGAYNDEAVGSGTPADDSGDNLILGNLNLSSYGFNGEMRIARIGVWNTIKPVAFFRSIQFMPIEMWNDSACQFLMEPYSTTHLGDLSGNLGNGTNTNGTNAPHVPLSILAASPALGGGATAAGAVAALTASSIQRQMGHK